MTGPVGGARPGSEPRILSLPCPEPVARPAEIEFRDLRYFAVVMEKLNFDRAARC